MGRKDRLRVSYIIRRCCASVDNKKKKKALHVQETRGSLDFTNTPRGRVDDSKFIMKKDPTAKWELHMEREKIRGILSLSI